MKYRLRLVIWSSIMFFYSCSQSNSSASKQTLFKPDSLNEASPSLKSEEFNDFFLLFSKDTAFQLERTIFPLEAYSLDSTETIIRDTPLQREQWKHLNLLFEDGRVTCIYDNFKHQLRNTDERVFSIEQIEHEGATYYYFKRIKSKWYLIKQEAFSY